MKTHKHLSWSGVLLAAILLLSSIPVWAGSDLYIGDTSIYNGDTQYLRPNVLLLIDNSAGMRQAAGNTPYNPATVYTVRGFVPNAVYVRAAATGGTINYNSYLADVNTAVSCAVAKTALLTTGFYAGPLKKSDGSCNAAQGDNYYLGNILNYMEEIKTNAPPGWVANKAYKSGDAISAVLSTGQRADFVALVTLPDVVTIDPLTNTEVKTPASAVSGGSMPNFSVYNTCIVLQTSTLAKDKQDYANLGCVNYEAGMPDGGDINGDGKKDLLWVPAGDLLAMLKAVLSQVLAGAREYVNFGVMTFGSNNSGGAVIAPIKEIDSTDLDGAGTQDTSTADFVALRNAINGITMLNANSQPVNELFWDASLYYRGFNSSTSKISSERKAYLTPIKFTCQKNYVILLTTGAQSTTNFTATKVTIGDRDGNGTPGYGDDAAKYLYDQLDKLSPFNGAAWPGVQQVQTTVVQLLTPGVEELKRAADGTHGRGSYYNVQNSAELTAALLETMINIVMESDTSFVAPVVPTSPENRTYSGERVYLGFFKPLTGLPWHGNLKKYGFDARSQVVDKNDAPATKSDGSFEINSTSYWSHVEDGTAVEKGGVGDVLVDRDFDSNPRKIYTNRTTAPANLWDSANAFNATNVLPAEVGYVSTDTASRDKLVKYIYGYDAYDDDGDGNTAEKRAWIMGDILHSKPQLVNYNTYAFTKEHEANCGINKTMIYVGTNDGQFHAFRDCDGEELWSFIPKQQLGTLRQLGTRRLERHPTYNDASATVYTYDSDNDGNLGASEAADGDLDNGASDKVLLLLGARRGGEYYLALDVTDPERPVLLWQIIRSSGALFSQLKETWSEPKLGKVKYQPVGATEPVTKLAMFFGFGYDNRNEDTRFGPTMTYPNSTPYPFFSSADSGPTTSVGSVPAANLTNFPPFDAWGNPVTPSIATGRGVAAVELASLDAYGVPTLTVPPRGLWSQTYSATDADLKLMVFSFPTDLALGDLDYDGYIDRVYAGDAGGQLWRFSDWDATLSKPVVNPLINRWVAKRIFVAGTAGTDAYPNTEGRKIFYRPSITFETNNFVGLYFGTGDREHPLNTSVRDRMYAVYDRGQDSFGNAAQRGGVLTNIGAIDDEDLSDVTTNILQDGDGSNNANVLDKLYSPNWYGWYITLNLRAGEKALAPPLVLNKVAYYTTYTPNVVAKPDPCSPGNLGISRVYAVNYKTGEAVLNFDKTNDGDDTTLNDRAAGQEGEVLKRSDRELTVGVGIPSGLVTRMPPNGDVQVYIGGGGGLKTVEPVQGGTIIPVYWIKW